MPHAHIHLIPLQSVEDINFSKPKLKLDSDMMKGIAEKIISGFNMLSFVNSIFVILDEIGPEL